MATKRIRSDANGGDQGRYTSPDREVDPDNVSDPEVELLSTITQLGGEGVENCKANVYRLHPIPAGMPNGRPLFVASLQPPFGIDLIQERFGGGYYSVLFVNERGVRVAARRFAVEGAPKVLGQAPAAEQTPFTPRAYDPPLALSPVVQTDPTLALILKQQVDLLDFLRQQSQRERPMTEHLEEIRVMAETMRNLTGGPPKVEPEELSRWMREGYELRKALDEDSPANREATEPPGWVEGIIAALPRVLDYFDARRAAAAGRTTSSSVRRAVAAPPAPLQVVPLPTAGTAAVEHRDADAPRTNPMPKWINALAKQFVRCAKQNDYDAEYMASWIERNLPAAKLAELSGYTPGQAKAELMRLAPLVQQKGVLLSEDFVNEVVRALYMAEDKDDEPETATLTAEPEVQIQ